MYRNKKRKQLMKSGISAGVASNYKKKSKFDKINKILVYLLLPTAGIHFLFTHVNLILTVVEGNF